MKRRYPPKTEEQKAKQRAYANAWRAKDPEKVRQQRRAWYQKNKEAYQAYQRQWLKDHPGVGRDRHYKAKYGLSTAEVLSLSQGQEGLCKLCLLPFTAKKGPNEMVVDHSHRTGKVRALLCSRCNIQLETLESRDEEWIIRAWSYLIEHGDR